MAEDRRGPDRYRLAAVRDVRARAEQGKRGQLAAAIGDAKEIRATLDAVRMRTHVARTALTGAISAREALLATGATGSRVALAEQFVLRRRRELEAAIREELRIEAADVAHHGTVDVARGQLARARADREIIERHFEQWRHGKKQLAERRED